MRGRQRLFKACQPGSILSHSYLVCLDRHSTKGEGRKRQQGTTGMRIEWHCITAGSEDLCCHFWAVKGSEEPTVTQSQNLSVDYVQLSVILFLSESANNSQLTAICYMSSPDNYKIQTKETQGVTLGVTTNTVKSHFSKFRWNVVWLIPNFCVVHN